MRKRRLMFKMLRSPACLWFVCMMAGGGASVAVSNTWNRPFYVEIPVRGVSQGGTEKGILWHARAVCEAFAGEEKADAFWESSIPVREAEGDGAGKERKEAIVEADYPERLNFAFYYEQGVPAGDASQSYAGKVYQALLKQDASWMSGIYGLRHVTPEAMAARLGKDKSSVTGIRHLNGVPLDGEENAQVIPSWNRFNVTFRDGDGTAIIGHSNIKEILSLASVYAYFNQEQSYDFLLSYADKLWRSSHSYKISVSDVYYCQGECLYNGGHDSEDEYDFPAGNNGGTHQEVGAQDENAFLSSDGVAWQKDGAEISGGTPENGVSVEEGKVSSEPVPAVRSAEDSRGTGQVSHEPNPAFQAGETAVGQGGGQAPSESVPAYEPAAEGAGQEMGPTSQELSPAFRSEEETSQGAGQVSHEPIPASQPADGGAGQETGPTSRESVPEQPEWEQVQGAGQASHEPIPAFQESGAAPQETGNTSGESVLPAQTAGESGGEAGELWEESASSARTSGQTISGTKDNHYCQGHIDLNISAVIIGIEENKSLFAQSAAFAEHENSDTWSGWDDIARNCVKTIVRQDWYAEYGLTGQDTMFVHNPLSGSEVAQYMSLLPADTSQKRRKVVRQALLSIGCIPYYWGGKPSHGGFEGNGFGTVISPDEDGRILKGLDCSGWINWVYWTAFGSSLPAESTSGLMSCGRAVEKKNLQAGDILIRAGEQPHVYLFLAWAPDGSMYLIHETTGNINNVTIGTYDLDLPYYRCLINEE